MAFIEGNTSEEYVTALSSIFDDLEVSLSEEENNDSIKALQPRTVFKTSLECHSDGLSCSTPKRAYHRLLRKRILHCNGADVGASRTPEEVATLAAPKARVSPLPKLPPVVLTPWSKMLRDAMLEREQKIKKPTTGVPQRMSMRL